MLKEKKIMPPLWIAYPYIERYSIGWRWGSGESYVMKWGSWFEKLSESEQEEYQELFPEPVTWKGYWKNEHEGEDCIIIDDFIELWRENGTPKYSLEELRKKYSQGEKIEYITFENHQPLKDEDISKSCFSQWWKSEFSSDTNDYCCMEQFMMANKTVLFEDEEMHEQILQCKEPEEIEALGRKVKNFDESTWNEIKYSIVLNGNYLKFSQNPELREFLLSTSYSVIVETSSYDGIWGIKMNQPDKDVLNPLKWQGENLLGFALMEVRDEIRRVWENVGLCDMDSIG